MTHYQLSYRSGSSKEAHEKWLKGDERSNTLFCPGKKNIHGIEIRPYCGQLVKGPSVCAGSPPSESQASDEDTSSEDEHTPDYEPGRRMMWWNEIRQPPKTKNPFVPEIDTSVRLLMDGSHEWQLGGMTIVSGSKLLVTDMDDDCLRVFNLPTDSLATLPGEFLSTSANFECPWDVTTDNRDNIYVIDNISLQVLDMNGKVLQQRSRDIPANAGGIAAKGDRMAICDIKANTCEIYKTGSSGDLSHVLTMKLGRHYDGQMQNPLQGVAIDDDGNMYVSDPDKCVIHKYTQSGEILGQIQTGSVNPGSLAWHSGCGLLTADLMSRKIWLLTPTVV